MALTPPQYSGIDDSPLSIYVTRPFWTFLVNVRKLSSDLMCAL
jgi:hypothetical protein